MKKTVFDFIVMDVLEFLAGFDHLFDVVGYVGNFFLFLREVELKKFIQEFVVLKALVFCKVSKNVDSVFFSCQTHVFEICVEILVLKT